MTTTIALVQKKLTTELLCKRYLLSKFKSTHCILLGFHFFGIFKKWEETTHIKLKKIQDKLLTQLPARQQGQ